ncbi:MAG: DegT/DnrJ/EryC1/StrS family aminotransferase [Opitutales bacterium]
MDVLIDVGVAIDVLAQRSPFVEASTRALSKAASDHSRAWLYVGSVQTLSHVLKGQLQVSSEGGEDHETVAAERLDTFTKRFHWLAALTEDAEGVFADDDPEAAQLSRAVARLGPHAKLLTRNPALLSRCQQAVSPEDFLELECPPQPTAFIDLAAQQDRLRAGIERRTHAVLRHGKYILGPEVAELEAELCAYTGTRECATCASGTDALLMALMALEIGPGDAVFTTPFTFVATSEVIALLGATPVYADIDPETFNLDPERLAEAIAAIKAEGKLRPGAIMPVDLFGLAANYGRIQEIASEHELPVIQDAAQAFGAVAHGKTAPAHGTIGCTSFFPAKPLGAYGDGGACFTDDAELAERLRSIRVHGMGADKYDTVRPGINGRLDTLQAAILLEKLAVYPAEVEARQRVAGQYCEAIGHLPDLRLPRIPPGYLSVYAQFTVRHPRRHELQQALKAAGIPTAIYYPQPSHQSSAYAGRTWYRALPEAERASREVLSLPFGPDVKRELIERIRQAWMG